MQENTNIAPPLHTNVGKKQAYYYHTISPTQIAGLADAILEKVFGFEQVPDMVTLTANEQGHFHFKAQFMYEDSIPFPQKRSTANKEKEKQKVKDIALAFFRQANEKVKANKQPKLENQDSVRPMFRDRDVDRGAFPSDFPDLFPIQYLEWQSTEPIFHPEYPKNIHYYEVRFRVELPVIAKQRSIIETPKTETVQNPETPVARLSSNAPTNHAPQTQKLVDTFLGNATQTPTVKATVQNEYIVLHINPDDKRYEIMGVESHFVQIAGQEITDLLEMVGENIGLYFLQEGNLKVPYWVAMKKTPVTKIGTTNDAAQPLNFTEEYCPMGIRVKFDMLYMIRELMEDGKDITNSKDYYKMYKEGKVLTTDKDGKPLTRGEKLLIKYEIFKRIKVKYLNKFIERLRAISGIETIDLLPSQIEATKLAPYENEDDPTIVVFTISVPMSKNNNFFETNQTENVLNTVQYMFHRAFKEGAVLWNKGFYFFKVDAGKGFPAEIDIKEGDKLINNSMFEMYGLPEHFINLTHCLAQDHNGNYLVSNNQFSYVMNHVFIEHLTGKANKTLDGGKAHEKISWHDIYFYLSKIPENGDKKKQFWKDIQNEIDRFGTQSDVVREQNEEGGNVLMQKLSPEYPNPCRFLKVIRRWDETTDKTIPTKWDIIEIFILKTPSETTYKHHYVLIP